ncbi:methyltransferase domain-containing protein [uncultured Ferrimonas sp.]|uniref:methyltransferase domain-containing protein n=1 Tax=uncultured Ferrimonas sp. TaxID=432640 RepID=UPI00262B871C|nr:methyltransferase domain-containing protein [uncultured Ferrimonas sp.]
MRPALNPNKVQPLSQWQSLPNGEWLQQQVEASMTEWWPKLFGYHLLKLGPLATSLTSSGCPIPHQMGLDPVQGAVRAQLHALPFKGASIDACVAPFCLEFQQDPHGLLREIDRVMICGGHLVLIGFSAISPLALGYMLPHLRQRPPWTGRMFQPSRVADWLGVLGYRIVEQQPLTLHSFMVNPERFGALRHTVEAALPMWGSVYMLVAQKMACPLTPVRSKWRAPRPLLINPIADLASYQDDNPRRSAQDEG